MYAALRAVKLYPIGHATVQKALDDLSTGGCDAFMKLAPVTAWFVRDRPKLKVVQVGITTADAVEIVSGLTEGQMVLARSS